MCTFCRRRKIKCDLEQPCSNCVKYNNLECVFEGLPPVQTAQLAPEPMLLLVLEVNVLKARLRQLEGQVTHIPQQQPLLPGGHPHSHPANANSTNTDPPSLTEPQDNHLPRTLLLDTINFHDGYTLVYDYEPVRRRHYSPLQWISLIKVDLSLAKLWDFITMLIPPPMQRLRQPPIIKDNRDELLFHAKTQDEVGLSDVEPFSQRACGTDEAQVYRDKLREKARMMGISFFENGFDTELSLLDKIQLVMPRRRVVWLLYKRWFRSLYVHVPIVDELALKAELERLIGPESEVDEYIGKITAEKRLDFVFLGQFLLILRMAYLSLFTNSMTTYEGLSTQDLEYLLANPVDIDAAQIADQCLSQFNVARAINFNILQLAMLMRYYRIYAPEEGDGVDGGELPVLIAMLVQMARGLGLHRDIEMLPDNPLGPRKVHLGRKLWWCLVVLDYNLRLQDGTPCQVSPESFDTKVPWYTAELKNCVNADLEKAAIGCIADFSAVMIHIYEVVGMISRVKGNVHVHELRDKLLMLQKHVDLQWFLIQFLLSLQLYDNSLSLEKTFMKVLGIGVYFNNTYLLASVWFVLFNYYELRCNNEVAYWHLREVIQKVVCDMMPFYDGVLNRATEIFSDTTDLFVIPLFENIHHQAIMVLLSVYVRLQFTYRRLSRNADHQQRLAQDSAYQQRIQLLELTLLLVRQCFDTFLRHILKLANRYYYAWRIYRGLQKFEQAMDMDVFYEKYLDNVDFTDFKFSNEMLEEINRMLSGVMEKVSRQRNAKKSRPERPLPVALLALLEERQPLADTDQMWYHLLREKDERRNAQANFDEFAPIAQLPDIDLFINGYGVDAARVDLTDVLELDFGFT